MIFSETELAGVYRIEPEKMADHRGFNARVWCRQEFEEHGITALPVQSNVISSVRRGTLRGLHYQSPPHAEEKLFRVTKGALYVVVVDLRPDSATRHAWTSCRLTADAGSMLFVPMGCAIGSQTLEDDTELTYQVSEYYTPGAGRGIRYDDPAFGFEWPLEVTEISEQDRSWRDYCPDLPTATARTGGDRR